MKINLIREILLSAYYGKISFILGCLSCLSFFHWEVCWKAVPWIPWWGHQPLINPLSLFSNISVLMLLLFRIASCPPVPAAVGILLWPTEPLSTRAFRTAKTGTQTHAHEIHTQNYKWEKTRANAATQAFSRALFLVIQSPTSCFEAAPRLHSYTHNTNTLTTVCEWSRPTAVSVTESQTLAGTLQSSASWLREARSLPPGWGELCWTWKSGSLSGI